MKKTLIIAFIIGFVCVGNALADEYVSGWLTVTDMTVHEAINPPTNDEVIVDCDVNFIFITDSLVQQEYDLSGTAFGNALNIALWTANLMAQTVYSELRYNIFPFSCAIMNATYPTP